MGLIVWGLEGGGHIFPPVDFGGDVGEGGEVTKVVFFIEAPAIVCSEEFS